mgnify:CR=1 FL=1
MNIFIRIIDAQQTCYKIIHFYWFQDMIVIKDFSHNRSKDYKWQPSWYKIYDYAKGEHVYNQDD